MTYRLTLIGHPSQDGTINTSRTSTEMFTTLLGEAFQGLDYIVKTMDVYHMEELEPTDIILTHTYTNTFQEIVLPLLKNKKRYYYVFASFMEVAQNSELPFIFMPYYDKYVSPPELVVPCPCPLKHLPVQPKRSKTILLDHDWPKPEIPNWMHAIQEALMGITSEYEVFVIDGGANTPSHLKSLPYRAFPEYIRQTNGIETFVVTHKGSYNASVIDMLARGIRVIAPRGFIPKANVERFGIPEFDSMDEMISLLKTPYDSQTWEHKRSLCTDISEAVVKMDAVFKQRL